MAGQAQDFRLCCVEGGSRWLPLNRKLASHQSFGDTVWLEASQRPVPGKSTRKEPLTLDCSHWAIIGRMGRCDMSLEEDHWQREVKDDPGAESRKLNVKELFITQERI